MNKVRVLLSPSWTGETVNKLSVCIQLSAAVKQGDKIFAINEKTTVKTFCAMDGSFSVRDASGEIHCNRIVQDRGYIQQSQYLASRDCRGEIVITYTLLPGECGNNPVFDLGTEKGGMNGSGYCFMPYFAEGEYEYTLHWDLSALPPGSTGAWSFGEGKTVCTGREDLLVLAFYAAGKMDCVRLGNFSYYWYNNDAILNTAVDTARIFRCEADFFEDGGEPYTIFARHVAKKELRAGGTALTRSYMYLYQNNAQLDPTWLKFLFAHEMVHNWVHLNDEEFGTCTWYVEGMAEFYSVLLPWRMGLVTREELLKELNKRARQYYENPAITVTNMEAGAGLFTDRERTRIPYGRGFFYLTHADGMIRRATGGKQTLDHVVRTLNAHYKQDRTIGNEAWIDIYGSIVGCDIAHREWEEMAQGGQIIPDVACYEGAVALEETEGIQRESGLPCKLWNFVSPT